MKNIIFCLCFLLPFTCLEAQTTYPEDKLDTKEIRAQLEFLASDFLRGRRTNSPGLHIAAEFLSAHLKAYGYDVPKGQDHYHQDIPLIISTPPAFSSLTINGKLLSDTDDYLILSGSAAKISGDLVFAGHGWVDVDNNHDDYEGLDVKGKIVFVLPGAPGSKAPGAIFEAMATKRKLAEEHGAAALFELYQLPFPWGMFSRYFGGESIRLSEKEEKIHGNLVYGWLNKTASIAFESIQKNKDIHVQLESEGSSMYRVNSSNVIGILPGSDPVLKDEYLLLTAHYDHVGVGEQGGNYTPQDSIFNGARDNGIGVVALLAAAKSFAEQPPRRSVIILALTGEEVGLLGSQYYADNPLIPLKDVVFNLNTDGAGYTDTSAISIIGWGRTGTDKLITAAAKAYGLKVIANPVPQMQLFDRSDNVSFAKKGIPCLSFSPGFSEFNNELMKNYHQVSDDTSTLDWAYITRYCQAFTRTARLLANAKSKPKWVKGDKYEAASKMLYD